MGKRKTKKSYCYVIYGNTIYDITDLRLSVTEMPKNMLKVPFDKSYLFSIINTYLIKNFNLNFKLLLVISIIYYYDQ